MVKKSMKINSNDPNKYNFLQTNNNKTNSPAITSCKSNNIAFNASTLNKLSNVFDAWNPKVTPLERLQNLAQRALNQHEPLGDAIYRGDFKGIIKKEDIIKILKEQRDNTECNGIKQVINIYIQHVNETH